MTYREWLKSREGAEVKKAKCYECKYRGRVAGDAHSCCEYPGTVTGILDFLDPQNKLIAKQLNIKGHEQGIRGGWFMWPVNFDPTWLISCDGFEEQTNLLDKEEKIVL